MIRKYLLVCISLVTLYSCNIDNDNPPNFTTQFMPIISVNVPDEFVFGETHQISMTYLRPTDCYEFNDFFYQVLLNERTVAVINTRYMLDDCMPLDEIVEVSFDFPVNNTGPYIFKFFTGIEDGVDQYIIVEVPVVE